MIVVTAKEMRELDRLTIEKYGVPSLTLMERAGIGVVDAMLGRFGRLAQEGVLVVAGRGNNGGDGLVVARHLKRKRVPCEVALLGRKEDLSPDAAANLQAYQKARGKFCEISTKVGSGLAARLNRKRVVVDAILGTGLSKEVGGFYREAIELINASGLPVVAVDLPSGLDSDAGRPLGTAIQAEMTVTFGYPKLGQVIYPGLSYVGELVVADIGIRAEAVAEVCPRTELLDSGDISWLVPVREADSHKGTYGHLVVLAGSRGKTGAASLACRAAMRVGTGLVTLAGPRALNNIYASSLVEVMTEPLANSPDEDLEPLNNQQWERLLEKKSTLLFGPGIGVKASCQTTLRWLLRNLELPWVIDADGLNNLAADPSGLRRAKTVPVLTPHPGEMARLIGADTGAVNRDRTGVASHFARDHHCYVVLKGARTVIATPQGRVFINPTGNPGMASGGTGDVLAGILAGLLAQGLAVEDSLKLGVFLHGFAGDLVATERGQIGMIASDIVEMLPEAMRRLSQDKTSNVNFKLQNARFKMHHEGRSGKI